MSIRVRCGACGGTFQADRKYEGRRARCPKCAEPVEIVEFHDDLYPPGMVVSETGDSARPAQADAAKSLPRAEALEPPAVEADPAPNVDAVFGGSPQAASPQVASEMTSVPQAASLDAAPGFNFTPVAGGEETSVAARHAARRKGGLAPLLIGAAIVLFLVAGLAGAGVYFVFAPVEDDNSPPVAENPAPAPADGPIEQAPGTAPQQIIDSTDKPPEDRARLLALAQQFTVKLRVDKPGGSALGAGFFVPSKGWVATSGRLLEGATAVRVEFPGSTPTIVESAGIVRLDRAHDLALISVQPNRSFVEAALRQGPPLAAGTELFAVAMPAWGDEWIKDCTLIAQQPTYELPAGVVSDDPTQPAALDRDMSWLELAGTLAPGGEGGPLLDARGSVCGVCLVQNVQQKRVYAADGRHLATLLQEAQSSADEVQPFSKDPGEVAAVTFDMEEEDPGSAPATPGTPAAAMSRADELVAKMSENLRKVAPTEGYPLTSSQYADFQELALRLTVAAVAAGQSDTSPDERAAIEQSIVETLNQEIDWKADDHIQTVNRLAAQGIDEGTSRGIYAFGTVVSRPGKIVINEKPAVGFELPGTNEMLLATVEFGADDLQLGTKWLIYGAYRGRIDQLSGDPGTPSARRTSLIDARFLVGSPDNP